MEQTRVGNNIANSILMIPSDGNWCADTNPAKFQDREVMISNIGFEKTDI